MNTVVGLGFLTAGLLAANMAFAGHREVYIGNDGYSDVLSVEISHIDDEVWGPDLLGPYVIPAGTGMWVEPVRIQGYCRFDVRITYTTGAVIQLWDENLCEDNAISVDGYTAVAY